MARNILKIIGISSTGFLGLYGLSSRTVFADEQPEEADAKLTETGSADPDRKVRFSGEEPPSLDNLRLRCVQVFFRHGARTPIQIIPLVEQAVYEEEFFMPALPYATADYVVTDLKGGLRPFSPLDKNYYKTKLLGGCVAGQLTKLGQDQCYQLGRALRKAYMEDTKLIGQEYFNHEVYVRSTNITRTIKSALSVVVGLFGDQYFDEKGPVVIPVSPMEEEILFPNPHVCKRLHEISRNGWHHMDDIPGVKEMRTYIQNQIGFQEGDPRRHHRINLSDCRDDLTARQAHGLPLPDFLQEHFDTIDSLAVKVALQALRGTPENKEEGLRLSVGSLLKMVDTNMDVNSKNHSKHKLFLYSVHDSTLMPLLESVGMFDGKWAPYAADVRFEMYEDSLGDYWVRALYLGQETKMSKVNASICRLEEFKEIISPYVISKECYRTECVSKQKMDIISKVGSALPKILRQEDEEDTRSDRAAGM